MSSVRMCDRCGVIFSERTDGWETYTGSTMRRDETGRKVQIQTVLDACSDCAVGDLEKVPVPNIGLPKQISQVTTDDAASNSDS